MILFTFSSLRSNEKGRQTLLSRGRLLTHSFCSERCCKSFCGNHAVTLRCGYIHSSSSPSLLKALLTHDAPLVYFHTDRWETPWGKCFPLSCCMKCTGHFWMLFVSNKYLCITLGHRLWPFTIHFQYIYYISDRRTGFPQESIKPLRFGLILIKIRLSVGLKWCRIRQSNQSALETFSSTVVELSEILRFIKLSKQILYKNKKHKSSVLQGFESCGFDPTKHRSMYLALRYFCPWVFLCTWVKYLFKYFTGQSIFGIFWGWVLT